MKLKIIIIALFSSFCADAQSLDFQETLNLLEQSIIYEQKAKSTENLEALHLEIQSFFKKLYNPNITFEEEVLIKRLYQKYETQFKLKWEGTPVTLAFYKKFWMFREFEKILFPTFFKKFNTDREKYYSVKESFVDITSSRRKYALFSEYYSAYSAYTADREYSYLKSNVTVFYPFLIEDLEKFSFGDREDLKIEDYFYFQFIVTSLEKVEGEQIENLLFSKFEEFKKFNAIIWTISVLAKRGTENGYDFLLNVYFEPKDDVEIFFKDRILGEILRSPNRDQAIILLKQKIRELGKEGEKHNDLLKKIETGVFH